MIKTSIKVVIVSASFLDKFSRLISKFYTEYVHYNLQRQGAIERSILLTTPFVLFVSPGSRDVFYFHLRQGRG